MRVKLTRKLADHLDGIDLSECREGAILALPDRDAELLIAEQWAIAVTERAEVRGRLSVLATDRADDAPPRHIRLVPRSDGTPKRRG